MFILNGHFLLNKKLSKHFKENCIVGGKFKEDRKFLNILRNLNKLFWTKKLVLLKILIKRLVKFISNKSKNNQNNLMK